MNCEDFQTQYQKARLFIEAMIAGGNIKINQSSREFDDSSSELSPIRKRSISPEYRKGEVDLLPFERFHGKKNNYNQIAEKNAQELISEEEKAKIKAEKKKAKKERQRQKKINKIIDLSDTTWNNKNGNTNSAFNEENFNENKEDEGFDVNAAFVSKAIKKVKNITNYEEFKPKKEEKDLELLINKVLELEHEEKMKEAIHFLSEAINLAPKRVDLLLKRSLMFYDLAKYEKSARDAHKALLCSPNYPEAYYRLGEAHLALNNLLDAESAFTKLLPLDYNQEEVENRIVEVRIKQLEEMGYHPNEAFTALRKSKNKTIEEAIEFLTNLENGKEPTDDLYYSDEDEQGSELGSEECDDQDDEDYSEGAMGPKPAGSNVDLVIVRNCPLLTDPSNIFQCSSLFVGNLKKDVTEEEILEVFSRYGDIKSIKLTTFPKCYAFINYEESESAGLAMEALQGNRWLLGTLPLLIKFPHNIVNSRLPYLNNIELIKSKLSTIKQAKVMNRSNSQSVSPKKYSWIKPMAVVRAENSANKEASIIRKDSLNMKSLTISEAPSKYPVVKPVAEGAPRPVPGTEECYFWQTTGCTYGNKCFNLHIPEHKGIALKTKKNHPYSTRR